MDMLDKINKYIVENSDSSGYVHTTLDKFAKALDEKGNEDLIEATLNALADEGLIKIDKFTKRKVVFHAHKECVDDNSIPYPVDNLAMMSLLEDSEAMSISEKQSFSSIDGLNLDALVEYIGSNVYDMILEKEKFDGTTEQYQAEINKLKSILELYKEKVEENEFKWRNAVAEKDNWKAKFYQEQLRATKLYSELRDLKREQV